MRNNLLLVLFLLGYASANLGAQDPSQNEAPAGSLQSPVRYSTGWADQAVTTGYVTAPATLGLMFVSALVNEWNAGYAGVPASAMILLAPPLIYAGGRSVDLGKDIAHPRAKLGWTDYALTFHPTSMAL